MDYTIEAQLTGPQCWAKDATASVDVTAPTCTANGSAAVVDLVNAKLDGVLDLSVGKHSATFKSDEGHLFANGEATKTVDYTIEGKASGSKCGTTEDNGDGPRGVAASPWILGGSGGLLVLGLGGLGWLFVTRRRHNPKRAM